MHDISSKIDVQDAKASKNRVIKLFLLGSVIKMKSDIIINSPCITGFYILKPYDAWDAWSQAAFKPVRSFSKNPKRYRDSLLMLLFRHSIDFKV